VNRDLHRAVLAVTCVFAVILGATLFPATGFGANPVPGDGSAGVFGDSTASGANGGSETPTRTDTTRTDSGSDDADETVTADGDGTSSVDGTETATADSDGSDGGTVDDADGSTETTAGAGGGDDAQPTARTTTQPADEDSDTGLVDTILASALFGSLLLIIGWVLTGIAAVIVLATLLGSHHRRRNPGQWDLPEAPHLRVLAYVRRIPQTSLSFALYTGSTAPGIIDQLGSELSNALSGFGGAMNGLASLGSTLGAGLVALPMGFIRAMSGLNRGVGSISLGLSSLTSGIGTGSILGSGAKPGDDPRGGGGRPGTASAAEPPEPPEPPASVREAWERLQEDLGLSGSNSETPVEIARRAVQSGVPTDAARTLTGAFRDVRYGGYPDDGERLESARDAYQRIRSALEGESS
jgi:hypothetical protein